MWRGVKFWPFPLTLIVVLTTLSHYSDTQAIIGNFYRTARELLDRFYSERTITVSSRDPDFITASIKARLRRRNKLMRGRRQEEADVLTAGIGKDIKQRNKVRLNHIDGKTKALYGLAFCPGWTDGPGSTFCSRTSGPDG